MHLYGWWITNILWLTSRFSYSNNTPLFACKNSWILLHSQYFTHLQLNFILCTHVCSILHVHIYGIYTCIHLFWAIINVWNNFVPLGDQIAKDLVDYTEAETLNPSMVRALSEFASNLSTVQDYRQAQVGGARGDSVQVCCVKTYSFKAMWCGQISAYAMF